jgi:hypothetical protein
MAVQQGGPAIISEMAKKVVSLEIAKSIMHDIERGITVSLHILVR